MIIIEDDLRVTVLNEPGPPLSASDRDRLFAASAPSFPGSASPPPAEAASRGARRHLRRGRRARARAGAITVVDATRDALRACLPFEPDVVTPNLAEATAVHGVADEAVEAPDDDARAAAVAAARSRATPARELLSSPSAATASQGRRGRHVLGHRAVGA